MRSETLLTHMMKHHLLFLLPLLSSICPAQKLNVDSISKANGTLGIKRYERLSNNYAPFVKNLYALHFTDGSTRIYNKDNLTLANDTFYSFVSNYQTYLGLSNFE